MKFVVAQPGPSFSVQDVYVGWVEALRELGQEVIEYNLDDRLTFYTSVLRETDRPGVYRKALDNEGAHRLASNGLFSTLYQTRPDVLMVISAFFLPTEVYDLARAYGTKVVIVYTEQPYEHERHLKLAEHADINLLDDPTRIDEFPKNTFYVPHAYRPDLHYPGPAKPELVCDMAFVGTGYPSRVWFLEQMDLDGLDVLLGGNWKGLKPDSPLRRFMATGDEECVDNDVTVDVYRSTRVGLNLYRREAERPELGAGWAMGPREVEMAATGCFFLRDPRGEGDEVLDMLPTFTSPEEAGEQLRWWLAHEDARQEAAGKAREAVAERTFRRYAVDLLRLLEKGV